MSTGFSNQQATGHLGDSSVTGVTVTSQTAGGRKANGGEECEAAGKMSLLRIHDNMKVSC